MPDDPTMNRVAEVIRAITGPLVHQTMPSVDLQDVRAVFEEGGPALSGSGTATGESGKGRATQAAEAALTDLMRQMKGRT